MCKHETEINYIIIYTFINTIHNTNKYIHNTKIRMFNNITKKDLRYFELIYSKIST